MARHPAEMEPDCSIRRRIVAMSCSPAIPSRWSCAEASRPVTGSLAWTRSVPSASSSNVTETFVSPRDADFNPASSTSPRYVFNENAVHCFWMKNTLIPLSIAFMRADGTVTDIDEMQAETTNNHCPKNNGVYALEMSKGWFSSKGIKPGMKIQGLPAAQ